MAELRWILLGFGVVLIAAVWLWGRRRPAAVADDGALLRSAERYEPQFEAEHAPEHDDPGSQPVDEVDLPTIEVPIRVSDERRTHGANPPVITIDDLPENAEDVVLIDAIETATFEPMRAEPRRTEPRPAPTPQRQPEPLVGDDDERADNAPHAEPPTVTIEVPTLKPEAAVGERHRTRAPAPPVVAPLPPPLATSDPLADTMVGRRRPSATPPEPPPRQQRIVAIRLIATTETPIDGAALKASLAAERLVFGRYSIFHRLLEGDRPVYSVASLVEPGSFEPELMAAMKFPGVSLFAVFPGPLPAPQVFDELLATARRLADKLGGALQDDTGSSLTGQRVLSLREDLVYFEHLVSLGRGRSGD